MTRVAFITGITGQDGSYLAELLLEKGYDVHGLIRRSSTDTTRNISHLVSYISLHQGDITDATCLHKIIRQVRPSEIYHEADQDHVGFSLDSASYSADVTIKGTINLLEAIVTNENVLAGPRIFIPSSATIFGPNPVAPQSITTHLNPQSPYACSKAAVLHLARYYRERYGLFISIGILYNHDSPRRGDGYLLHKIAKAAANQEILTLSNVEDLVAVGYAGEFVEAFHQMLALEKPCDLLIGSNYRYSIRQLAEQAYTELGLDPKHYIREISSESHVTHGGLIPSMSKAFELIRFCPKIHAADVLRSILVDKFKVELIRD